MANDFGTDRGFWHGAEIWAHSEDFGTPLYFLASVREIKKPQGSRNIFSVGEGATGVAQLMKLWLSLPPSSLSTILFFLTSKVLTSLAREWKQSEKQKIVKLSETPYLWRYDMLYYLVFLKHLKGIVWKPLETELWPILDCKILKLQKCSYPLGENEKNLKNKNHQNVWNPLFVEIQYALLPGDFENFEAYRLKAFRNRVMADFRF